MVDSPKCYDCKNYKGSDLCEKYKELPEEVFLSKNDCEKFEKKSGK